MRTVLLGRAPVSRWGLQVSRSVQLFEEFLVLTAQFRRSIYVYRYKLVAFAVPVKMWETLISHPENFSGLYPGFDFELGPSGQCRHLDLAAQGRLGEAQVELVDDIISVALEIRMTRFFYNCDEVAAGSATPSGITLATESQVVSLADARGYLYLYGRLSVDTSGATACGAGILNDFAGAAAGAAGYYVDELSEHRSCGSTDLSGAAACRAG